MEEEKTTVEPAAVPWWWDGPKWTLLPFVQRIDWPSRAETEGKRMVDLVQEERARLAALRNYLPMLRALRSNLEVQRDHLSKPHQRVWRVHTERLIERVATRIGELERGTDQSAFEENVRPYFLAHAQAEEDGIAPRVALREQRPVIRPSLKTVRTQLSEVTEEFVGRDEAAQVVVNEMLAHVMPDPSAPRVMTANHDTCRECGEKLEKAMRDLMMRCPKCNFCFVHLDTTASALTFGDEVELNESSSNQSRLSHWIEYINGRQGKEQKIESTETLVKIAKHLYETKGIRRNDQITVPLVFESARALGFSQKQLRRVVQIAARLGSRRPPRLSRKQVVKCRVMFHLIEGTFNKLFPHALWFNNPFCFLCICRTMGWSQFYEVTPLLMRQQDYEDAETKMRAIYRALGWEYKPLPYSHLGETTA